MKTAHFNINELQKLSSAITVLRACPALPFALANQLNGRIFAIQAAEKEFEEEKQLLTERFETAAEGLGDEEKQALLQAINRDFLAINSKKRPVKIAPLSAADFEGLDISGHKEIVMQNGQAVKFAYRDSYFDLVGLLLL